MVAHRGAALGIREEIGRVVESAMELSVLAPREASDQCTCEVERKAALLANFPHTAGAASHKDLEA